jgi:hypothetical protein
MYLNDITPDYICFNEQSCNSWPFVIRIAKISEPTTLLSCVMSNNISSISSHHILWDSMLPSIRRFSQRNCAWTVTDVENDCPKTTQFRCDKNCLSKHRLVDDVPDCANNSDEKYTDSCALNDKHRIRCTYTRNGVHAERCILEVFTLDTVGDSICTKQNTVPHFPTLCDSYIEDTDTINGQIETDEKNCEEWLCDNQYTRCDGIWNCLNGADELHCPLQFCRNENAHPCILWNSSQPICLPISRAGDGVIDCVGATDERHLCRGRNDNNQGNDYRCWNNDNNNEQMMNK